MPEQKPIKFTELFHFSEPTNAKIKLNRNNTTFPAWDLLLHDDPEWEIMNAYRGGECNNNHKMNGREYLFAFAQYYPYGKDYYIFGGLYRATEIQPPVYEGIGYKLEHMDQYAGYEKRLIIRINKVLSNNEPYMRLYEHVQDQLDPIVHEIAPRTKLGTFNGYDHVTLTHGELQDIINHDEPEWRTALSAVKAVYVITDRNTGKLYVGSASSDNEGLWTRWSTYANLNDPTGGNKEMIELRNKYGAEYITSNFSYSILEIFDKKTSRDTVLSRESYWKGVLRTIEFGMNDN